MNPGELFTRAVAMLPEAVRERLDGDVPLDWAALEDPETGTEIGEAVHDRRRLPRPVEALVHRLVRDVGIVPADVCAGAERHGTASAWIHWVTIEADGESYQIRNDRSGEVQVGIHPEAVAGYATLGLELAAMVHEAGERWIEAGERCRAAPVDRRSRLAECAVRMFTHLRAQPETISGRPTAASLARTLEYAWNAQRVEVRAALARTRITPSGGAQAPRKSYYSPGSGYRLSACDAGELRWLRGLAERAGEREPGEGAVRLHEAERAAPEGRADVESPAGSPAESPVESPVESPIENPGAPPEHGVGFAGTVPDTDANADAAVAELGRSASHLPDAVRERMGQAYGAGVAQALTRLGSESGIEALRAASGPEGRGRGVPGWLERLAVAVLRDAGAPTRDGLRTDRGPLRPRRGPGVGSGVGSGAGYRDTGNEGGERERPAAAERVEQVRLGLAFAQDAWTGLTALRGAGKEGSWTLTEAEAGSRELAASEHETLEAAQEIGRTLDRVEQAHAGARGDREPTALEQAAMTAEALTTVGPSIRTAAGWPGVAEAPNARDPADVARVAAVAEALRDDIRTVSNRLIAGWIAEAQRYGGTRGG